MIAKTYGKLTRDPEDFQISGEIPFSLSPSGLPHPRVFRAFACPIQSQLPRAASLKQAATFGAGSLRAGCGPPPRCSSDSRGRPRLRRPWLLRRQTDPYPPPRPDGFRRPPTHRLPGLARGLHRLSRLVEELLALAEDFRTDPGDSQPNQVGRGNRPAGLAEAAQR